MDSLPNLSVLRTAWQWFTYAASCEGYVPAAKRLVGVLWEFVLDSSPERLRARFGDADYDWDYRVNTTSGAVGWRDRLLGQFHSAYQPTDPTTFHEMLTTLRSSVNPDGSLLDFGDYTFVDLGSGKGRTLLMASTYPFRRVVGVELLPSLHETALQNLAQYKSGDQKCFAIESVCQDATAFEFPPDPLVLYLFNPLPESGMRAVLRHLEESIRATPRSVHVIYHNPLLEHVLMEGPAFRKIARSEQYSLFTNESRALDRES